MSRRSEQLLTIARDFLQVHDEWADEQKGVNRPNPDEIYWDAVQTLVESFAEGDIPADSRTLADSVSRFQDEADLFEDRDDETVLYPPRQEFWQAIDKIRKVAAEPSRRELPPLEPIAELARMPYMQHAQICRMWGFLDRNKNPITRLVQMELDSPGSVIGPAAKGKGLIDGRDWSDPRLADLERAEGAADRAVEAIEAKGRREKKEAAKCPETDRELWEQGVGIPQAARMLKEPEKDVAKKFAEWTAARDFNQKVWGLVDKGVPMPEICKQMKADPKRVEASIRERPAGSGAAPEAESEAA